MKKRYSLLILLVCILAVAGCSRKEEKKMLVNPQEDQKPKLTIGVAMANLEGDGYQTLKKTLTDEGKKQKVKALVENAKNDPLEQEKQVDRLISRKIKVLILHIIDPDSGQRIVERALKKGIKVIALERLPKNTGLDAYIAPDYFRTGELQGEFLAKELKSGLVYVLTGSEAEKSNQDLLAGVKKGLEANAGLTPKYVAVDDKISPQQIEMEVEKFLSSNPQPQGVIAQTGATTVAMVKHFAEPSLADKVVTVGMGADLNSTKSMLLKLHEAEVDTRPELVARQVLRTARALDEGAVPDFDAKMRNDESDVPVKIMPVRLIKQENLYLMEERWGKLGKLEKKARKQLEDQQKQTQKPEQDQEQQQGQGQQGQEDQQQGQQGKQQGNQQSQGQGGGQQQGQGEDTILKITTEDGKEMEVRIPGKVKEVKKR